MRRDIKDQTIIITGAGTGIGAATAMACARAGMRVVLNGRRPEPLQTVADKIAGLNGVAHVVAGDVAQAGVNQRLLDEADARFGGFYAVFANAGYGFRAPMHAVSDEALRQIFEVNFFAAVDLLRLAAKRLLADRRTGHLLMCSSAVARLTSPGYGPYSATKAAQHHICRAMNMELKPFGVPVSSVHPIGTKTEFFETGGKITRRMAATDGAMSTPAFFTQPPQRVARAVVRCLQRPKPEVWTSFATRVLTSVIALFPRVMDAARWVR